MLSVLGPTFEGLGILLLAAPDFLPGIRRFSRWVGVRVALWWRTVPNRLRRLLRRPQHVVVHSLTASATAGISLSGTAIVSHQGDTKELVAYLMRRDEVNQESAYRLGEADKAIRQSIEELRSEIETIIQAKLHAAAKDFQAARIAGAVALIVGLVLTSLA